MKLNQYPKQIAEVRKELLELDLAVESLSDLVKVYEADIKSAIAFNQELKNETQRKAKETEMKSNPNSDFYQVSQLLRQKREERELKSIEVELLRSQFSIAKLQKRESIAQLEMQAQLA